MFHARIAARAFNTPLLVEPSKAMAFLSGLGPRVLGRRVEMTGAALEAELPGIAARPAQASLLAGGLSELDRHHGDAPFPVVDGIAVIAVTGVLIHRGGWIGQSSGQTSYEGVAAQIDAAARDPTVRGVALEIDSFGGEVAGVFDLADRIRALRATKPVWAFVAENAFSAGYALASQADRILLPRTGAVGSIGVVVLHADHSGQLDQDGVRVTLIHAGSHKVDGNPYAPLPDAVREEVQREIDVLRFLFAETVSAGRGARLNQEAALATEAQTYRGSDAIAAGLADEITDLARGFDAFRQIVARSSKVSPPVPALAHAHGSRSASLSPTQRPRAQSRQRPSSIKETRMADDHDRNDTAQDAQSGTEVQGVKQDTANSDIEAAGDGGAETGAEAGAGPEAQRPAPALSPASSPQSAAAAPSASTALVPPALPAPATADRTKLADLSAQLRREAAEITEIAAQAGRLGIAIDAAKALREGTSPEALRALVLERASAAADARDIVAAPPSPVLPKASESPLVTAAKRAAAAGKSG